MLKTISDRTGMPIGTCANFLIGFALVSGGGNMAAFPPEIQTAFAADMLSAIGDLFKIAGIQAIRQTSIAELYERLLGPQQDS